MAAKRRGLGFRWSAVRTDGPLFCARFWKVGPSKRWSVWSAISVKQAVQALPLVIIDSPLPVGSNGKVSNRA